MERVNEYSLPQSEKAGAYNIVVRTSKSIVNPGDRIYFEIYISGYGQIANACVGIYPSWSIFDIKDSKVSVGDRPGEPMDPLAVIISIDNESFFDARGKYQISTECRTPLPSSKAPINLDMKVDRKATPGTHFVQFAFKFYNGESWNISTSTTSISIRNFYQRNETFVWFVGGIAAFLSILKSIYPVIKCIWQKLF